MLDAYSRRARLAPAALAAAPALAFFAGALIALERVGAIIAFVLAAVTLVLCGLVRDRGRAIEPALWIGWDGAPTTQLLRWSGSASAAAQRRRHRLLEEILGELLPSEAEERADPLSADRCYQTATAALRDLTRQQGRFALIAAENAEYGFRRNCLGLKPVALVIAVGSGLLSLVLAIAGHGFGGFLVPLAVSLLGICFWLLVVKGGWVRAAAERYAERLMEAAESLNREAMVRAPAPAQERRP